MQIAAEIFEDDEGVEFVRVEAGGKGFDLRTDHFADGIDVAGRLLVESLAGVTQAELLMAAYGALKTKAGV